MSTELLMNQFQKHQLFQHKDGGWYEFHASFINEDTGLEVVYYKHLWPFNVEFHGRSVEKFLENYKPASSIDFRIQTANDYLRQAARELVALKKEMRRESAKKDQEKNL